MEERPVLVVGAPRSGTTLLQLMLHMHPRIAIPPETRFTLRAYDNRRNFGDLTDPANHRALAEWMTGREHGFNDLGLDRAAVIESILAGQPTIGGAAAAIFRAYSQRFGKPRWGDKRPAYIINLDILRWMFPTAQIVHIIRDGRDCVASMKEAAWYRTHIDHGINQWVRSIAAGHRARRQLAPDQYTELRYENLVRSPEEQLRKICAFLGEEYAPEMCEPARIASVAVPAYKTWHALTHSDVTVQRIGTWRERLDPEEIALCESRMGRILADLGYEVSGAYALSATRRLVYAKRIAVGSRHRLPHEVRLRVDRFRHPDLSDR